MSKHPTFERLDEFFRLENGVLYWKKFRGGIKAGTKAGHINWEGYIKIRLDGSTLLGHRIVWTLVNGAWPNMDLDHINGIRSDNRPENLRLCNRSQNQANRVISKTGFKGVTKHKCGRFQATCAHFYLGLFTTQEAAAYAYDIAALRMYGEFAKTNYSFKNYNQQLGGDA